MELGELPGIKQLKQLRDKHQARNEKKLFFQQQFQKMVENGNIEKAVQLIHDESKNLDARLNKEVKPEDLAKFCLDKSEEMLEKAEEELENFQETVEELQEQYDTDEEN